MRPADSHGELQGTDGHSPEDGSGRHGHTGRRGRRGARRGCVRAGCCRLWSEGASRSRRRGRARGARHAQEPRERRRRARAARPRPAGRQWGASGRPGSRRPGPRGQQDEGLSREPGGRARRGAGFRGRGDDSASRCLCAGGRGPFRNARVRLGQRPGRERKTWGRGDGRHPVRGRTASRGRGVRGLCSALSSGGSRAFAGAGRLGAAVSIHGPMVTSEPTGKGGAVPVPARGWGRGPDDGPAAAQSPRRTGRVPRVSPSLGEAP